ncbi:MAG: CocE/NonD family hydrolase, partial [Candidatus Binatia bacterium]
VELLADRWFPASGPAPTLLVRSPYGRRSMFGWLYGRIFSERGFQVVIQSCRGTFGSGGAPFEPMIHEARDAADTVAWMRGQPWFGGAYATIGASYLCFTQWAGAREAAPELKTMIAQVGPHDFAGTILEGGSFALDSALSFAAQVSMREAPALLTILRQVLGRRRVGRAFRELPLAESCERALGGRVGFLEDWLARSDPRDAYWRSIDHACALETLAAPVFLQGGWYDMFAAYTVAQYEALRRRGRRPYLTMGPWTHAQFSFAAASTLLPETLAWLRTHLGGNGGDLRNAPVRVWVLGAEEWRDFADWPPPEARGEVWHLHPEGRLARDPAPESAPDRYRYDPADPTPSVGGGTILFAAGPRDNRKLEARADVLTYTSAPFDEDRLVVGSPVVNLHTRSSLRRTDFFARLCDVHPDGRSINLCDAIIRLEPADHAWQADGSARVRLVLSPTASSFARGHRLRLQISSGAHPRFARNTGDGEPLGTATRLVPADQEVLHDSSLEIRVL